MKGWSCRILLCFLVSSALVPCEGYRILGAFPFHGKSHFVMFEELMKGLARKGHQVDVISAFPQKRPLPNYNDIIVIPQPSQLINNLTYGFIDFMQSMTVTRAILSLCGNNICEYLGRPDFQKLIRDPPTKPPYDVVLMEVFGAHCLAVLGHLLNVPVVGVSSSAVYPWMNDIVANPENLAFVSNNLLDYPERMTFWQRLSNVIDTFDHKIRFNYLSVEQDDVVRKHIGPGMPSIRELESSIALFLVNTHSSINGIKPTTPALIEVGGLHVQNDGEELPPSLVKWLNESTDGFVYFSFGSMMKIESFPPETIDVFYKSLGKIDPIRVLMKIPDPKTLPPGLPKNIHTVPWVSQVKVLLHPNIKAFVTHGGLMGTHEAIACGVPMVGIPLFADQFINVNTCVRKKIAVKLDYETITEEKMDAALNAILRDPIYRESAKRLSRKFLDRPLSAMDTAIYWIEYVIRNGKDSLRSPALELKWWQLALLDVYAFLLLCLVCAIYVVYVIARSLSTIASAKRTPAGSKKLD